MVEVFSVTQNHLCGALLKLKQFLRVDVYLQKSDSRLSGGASARRSLPGHGQAKNTSLVITTSNRLAVDESTDSGVELSSHNPLKKLLDRGRKSLSARVKPSKREYFPRFSCSFVVKFVWSCPCFLQEKA